MGRLSGGAGQSPSRQSQASQAASTQTGLGEMTPPSRPSRPEALSPGHLLDNFNSGEASLDEWLKRRARSNELEGASRTFVTAASNRAVGCYSVAASAVL